MAGSALTPRAKVLTVSDGVADGSREDRSGTALAARLLDGGFEVVDHRVTADGREAVAAALQELTAGFAGLVVTTGGTGFGPRDLTPEGTRVVIDRGCEIPEGFVVGEDAAVDGQRFHRSEKGVVLITREMLARLPAQA